MNNLARYRSLLFLLIGIVSIFVVRTSLAKTYPLPRLFELFDAVTVVGSLLVLSSRYRYLSRSDWVIALALGGAVAAGMVFATLFTPYPYFGIVHGNRGQALVRGVFTLVAALAGLAIMRQGGPVLFSAADGEWRKSGISLLVGSAIGLPLAALNVLALQISTGQSISWQNPCMALLDALQPAIVEEMIYRFAFLGLLWIILRKSLPEQAAWLSGLLALLVHNFAHFSDLFMDAPLAALGMGTVMSVIWGLPLTILALRRDLDSAIAFHWVQDVARFLAGY